MAATRTSKTQAPPSSERLHKVLARAGWGSRREIERWIDDGRVRINGRRAEIGAQVGPGDRVQLDDGRTLRISSNQQDLHVLAYNKPAGEVCTRSDEQGRPNIFQHLPRIERGRWINIGRLDINTSGLLLFTNHGELAHRLMHPRYRVDREYAARIFGTVEDEMMVRLRAGVEIEGERFHFDDIVVGAGDGANRWYYCVVQSGRQREVRRLWESQGVQVSRLMRVRFGNVMLPTDLRAGQTVEIGGALRDELCALVGLDLKGTPRDARPRDA